LLKKLFLGAGGVWGFIDFQVVKYLIFREKVQEFSPRSPQWLALFEGKKVHKSYPTRFLDLYHFSLFVADILLLSPKKGEGLGVRELTISAITLEKWYYSADPI
jgi:hypothetical protein